MLKDNYKGLTEVEVRKLHQKYGFNEIKEKSYSIFFYFLKKFIRPIPIMIEIALLLSIILRRWEDFYIIFVLLGVNIGVEFIQEQKANKALNVLKNTLSPVATVMRDAILKVIDARELVPGDIIKLSIGDIVPAESSIIDNSFLFVDQATITGESLPVEKHNGDILYASTIVQKGVSYARVTAIGKNTFIGKSASLVEKAEHEKESHFQKAIFGISKFLIIFTIILIIITFIDLIIRGDSFMETIRFSLVLAVASIPVALPAVLSVTMAIGANNLAKNKTIVSNFKAIEEMAGVDSLCIDKTGTLTKNKIEVVSPKVFNNFSEKDLFIYALLLSGEEHTFPIEDAIYKYAIKQNLQKIASKYQIKTFIPFDPIKKMTEVSAIKDGVAIKIIMGAPQVIQGIVTGKADKESIAQDVISYANKGLRTIALAKKEGNKFILIGIIPLIDLPREDSKLVIEEIKKRGIGITILTGDHTAIATYIARLLGLKGLVSRKEDIDQRQMDFQSQDKNHLKIQSVDVFAEVTPKDKYQIVERFQKENHIVAMTGDGVNDSPALKKADIGIAVSGASPAARSASDIILLDNGLSIIKKAIDLSRATFSRMQSYAIFRISETIRIILFVTLSVLVFSYTPITAFMIILLALLNDIPVMAIAYDNAPIHKKPIRWELKETLIISSLLGAAGLISSFGLFYYLNTVVGYSIAIIQTILFVKLDVAGHSTLYVTRTGRDHFWKRPFPSLKFFLPAFLSRIIGTIIGLFGIFMQAISLQTIIYIWIYATIWFLINDQIKVWGYKAIDWYKIYHKQKEIVYL